MNQTRWQYQVLDIQLKVFATAAKQTERLQEELNRVGLQGWELVNLSAVPGTLYYRASFKRPS